MVEISSMEAAENSTSGFQDQVKKLIEEIDKEGACFDMTSIQYGYKKRYLKQKLTDLSHLYTDLDIQYQRLIKRQDLGSSDSSLPQVTQALIPYQRRTPICFDRHMKPGGGDMSSTEGSSSNSSLVNDNVSKLEETIDTLDKEVVSLTEKIRILGDENRNLKHDIQEKESGMQSQLDDIKIQKGCLKIEKEKAAELLKKNSTLEDEVASLKENIQSFEDENSMLKQEIQEKESDMQNQKKEIKTKKEELEEEKSNVVELKIQLAGSKRLNFENNRKLKRMKDELKASEDKLKASEDDLKTCKENYEEIDEHAAELLGHKFTLNRQILELYEKIDQKDSEIAELKNTYEARENVWKGLLANLKEELKGRSESIEDLTKNMVTVTSGQDGLNAKLERLRAEKCAQDSRIQELETSLNFLQYEHAGALLSFENVRKITNDLKLKLAELDTEVAMHKEVMSDKK